MGIKLKAKIKRENNPKERPIKEEKNKPNIKKTTFVQDKTERKITEIKEKKEIDSQDIEEFHGDERFGQVIAPVLRETRAPKQNLESQLQDIEIEKKENNEKEKKGKLKQDVYSASDIYNQQIYETMHKYHGEQEIIQTVKENAKQLIDDIRLFDSKSKFQKESLKSQETMKPSQLLEEPKYEFQRIELKTVKVPGMRSEKEDIIHEEKVKKYRVHGI